MAIYPSELLFASRSKVAAELRQCVGIEILRSRGNERVTYGFIGGVGDAHSAQATRPR